MLSTPCTALLTTPALSPYIPNPSLPFNILSTPTPFTSHPSWKLAWTVPSNMMLRVSYWSM